MKESISAVIRREIQDIMSDQEQRNIAQIKEELASHGYRYQSDYQESHLTGVLHLMRKSGQIHQISRGLYTAPAPIAPCSEKLSESDAVESPSPSLADAEQRLFSDLMSETLCSLRRAYYTIEQTMQKFTINSISSVQELEDLRMLIQLKGELLSLIKKYDLEVQINNTAQ